MRMGQRLNTGCGTPSIPSWLLLCLVVLTTSGLLLVLVCCISVLLLAQLCLMCLILLDQKGLVYAVEFSHRSGRDLVNMAKKRTNVIPIIAKGDFHHESAFLFCRSLSSRRLLNGELGYFFFQLDWSISFLLSGRNFRSLKLLVVIRRVKVKKASDSYLLSFGSSALAFCWRSFLSSVVVVMSETMGEVPIAGPFILPKGPSSLCHV